MNKQKLVTGFWIVTSLLVIAIVAIIILSFKLHSSNIQTGNLKKNSQNTSQYSAGYSSCITGAQAQDNGLGTSNMISAEAANLNASISACKAEFSK